MWRWKVRKFIFIKINRKSQDIITKRAKELACILAFLYSTERENIPFRWIISQRFVRLCASSFELITNQTSVLLKQIVIEIIKDQKAWGEREREKTDNDDYWITSSLSLRSLSVDGCNQNSLSHARDNVLHSFQFLKKSQAVCVQTKGL